MALAELVRRREVSPIELTNLARRAIAKINPILNFVAHDVLDKPDIADLNKFNDARFSGVPFLIKEGAAAIKGQPFNMASRLGVGNVAEADCELTKRFRQAGVTIVAQSTAPESGNAPTTESLLHGPTLNPWNLGAFKPAPPSKP